MSFRINISEIKHVLTFASNLICDDSQYLSFLFSSPRKYLLEKYLIYWSVRVFFEVGYVFLRVNDFIYAESLTIESLDFSF